MITLRASETKHPLFEMRIAPVPQGQPKAHVLIAVTDGTDAILAPAVGP
ncbi:unannotated protein [freshwater metagenome]|uniref:Unannotated protein n=1 Tax=freshwater metagenome TaxID=449393 RepID=A0A6J7IV22_9ZZZZ